MGRIVDGRLAGRRIVVTGSGGISSATVIRCVREAAAVHVIAYDPASIAELARRAPGITWSACDLSSDSETHAAFDEADASLGGVDGLVAVAGGSARRMGDGPVDQLSTEGLNATVALNLATTANALQQFTARWLAKPTEAPVASAVLIGSALARYPASPLFVTHGYAATKAAIEGMARSAAAHYSRNHLTVNVVAPGLTKTPMSTRAQKDEVVSAYARKRQPLTDDGFIDPDDVAEACEWVLGAHTLTGQVIYLDGGWSVYGG